MRRWEKYACLAWCGCILAPFTSPHRKINAWSLWLGTQFVHSWLRQNIVQLVLVREGMFQSHCWNKGHIWFGPVLKHLWFWTVNVQHEEVKILYQCKLSILCVRCLLTGAASTFLDITLLFFKINPPPLIILISSQCKYVLANTLRVSMFVFHNVRVYIPTQEWNIHDPYIWQQWRPVEHHQLLCCHISILMI